MPVYNCVLGLIVFFPHSWCCKRKTWFSEVMIFIVWHPQKAIPCLFGIRSPAGLPCDSSRVHPGLYAGLPAHSHESLIPFELSNARVNFRQPAHSAELHQPLPCKASHSCSEIDGVLGHLPKDKGGPIQHLRFAFKKRYHRHSSDFWSWHWWNFLRFTYISPCLVEPATSTLHYW